MANCLTANVSVLFTEGSQMDLQRMRPTWIVERFAMAQIGNQRRTWKKLLQREAEAEIKEWGLFL